MSVALKRVRPGRPEACAVGANFFLDIFLLMLFFYEPPPQFFSGDSFSGPRWPGHVTQAHGPQRASSELGVVGG